MKQSEIIEELSEADFHVSSELSGIYKLMSNLWDASACL